MDVIEKLEALREGIPPWDFSRISDFTDVIIEVKRMRAEVERLRAPNMFWTEDGAPVEDWTDALDGAPPREVQELDTARHLGPRYAVYIPRSRKWRDDCHLFTTHEEAEAAVAKAKGAQDG